MSKTPIALTTSDWHIRSTVPASRAELDWFEVRVGQANRPVAWKTYQIQG